VHPISGERPDYAELCGEFAALIWPGFSGRMAWSNISKLLRKRSFDSPFGGGWLHPSGLQFFIRHLCVYVFIYACGYVYMRLVDMGKYKGGLL
jgi:hypothetical protein